MTGKNYKLLYFNVRGQAELSRLIFAQAEVPYDDHRIKITDWPELKPGKFRKINLHIFSRIKVTSFSSISYCSNSDYWS